MSCEEHGDWNNSFSRIIHRGVKCPSCTKQKQLRDKTKYMYVLNIGGIKSFTGFGITCDLKTRMQTHRRNLKNAGCIILDSVFFELTDYNTCKDVEMNLTKLYKSYDNIDIEGFITENTSFSNYNSVIETIVNHNGKII
jgi:hypothetical protein